MNRKEYEERIAKLEKELEELKMMSFQNIMKIIGLLIHMGILLVLNGVVVE